MRYPKKVERRPDRIPDVIYPEKVERRPGRIPDVIYPEKVERRPGRNSGCDMSGWNVGGEEFRM